MLRKRRLFQVTEMRDLACAVLVADSEQSRYYLKFYDGPGMIVPATSDFRLLSSENLHGFAILKPEIYSISFLML